MKRFTQMTERNMSKANGGSMTALLVAGIGAIVVGATADIHGTGK